jgi:hypothetical protein
MSSNGGVEMPEVLFKLPFRCINRFMLVMGDVCASIFSTFQLRPNSNGTRATTEQAGKRMSDESSSEAANGAAADNIVRLDLFRHRLL